MFDREKLSLKDKLILMEQRLDAYSYNNFDFNNVIIKSIEEMGELIKELAKSQLTIKVNENLYVELIDVQICINQLIYSFIQKLNINFDIIKFNKLKEIFDYKFKYLTSIESDTYFK